MSGKQKALLIVLGVVLLVLLVVAFGMNSGKEKGDPNKPNGFVNFLNKFSGQTALDPDKVSGGDGCTAVQNQPHTFSFQGDCKLIVQDPGSMRQMFLKGTQPFHAEAPGPGDTDFTMKGDASGAPPNVRAKIPVDKKAEILLHCNVAPSVCVVTVMPSAQ
jgi:hypothetical protein